MEIQLEFNVDTMNTNQLIRSLQSSSLIAECPLCNEEFRLSDVLMFDGLGKFPESAEARKNELLLELRKRVDDLKKRKISATKGAEKKAIEVGFGKIIEKFIPGYRDLKIPIRECRPLFDPIDMIVFHGITNLKVNSLTFLEVKSGNSRLNKHQRLIQDAVLDKKVGFRRYI